MHTSKFRGYSQCVTCTPNLLYSCDTHCNNGKVQSKYGAGHTCVFRVQALKRESMLVQGPLLCGLY